MSWRNDTPEKLSNGPFGYKHMLCQLSYRFCSLQNLLLHREPPQELSPSVADCRRECLKPLANEYSFS